MSYWGHPEIYTLCGKCNKELRIEFGRTNYEFTSSNQSCPDCKTVAQTWLRIPREPGPTESGRLRSDRPNLSNVPQSGPLIDRAAMELQNADQLLLSIEKEMEGTENPTVFTIRTYREQLRPLLKKLCPPPTSTPS